MIAEAILALMEHYRSNEIAVQDGNEQIVFTLNNDELMVFVRKTKSIYDTRAPEQ